MEARGLFRYVPESAGTHVPKNLCQTKPLQRVSERHHHSAGIYSSQVKTLRLIKESIALNFSNLLRTEKSRKTKCERESSLDGKIAELRSKFNY